MLDSTLSLNISKTKEMIVDFRRQQGDRHSPIHISNAELERVSSFKFFGVQLQRICPGHYTQTLWSGKLASGYIS